MFDYLVVGAGFAGAVLAERLATQAGKKVLIVDKRNHIGGNTYDYYNASGILVHKYGPHIFHTNSREIYDYLGKFTHGVLMNTGYWQALMDCWCRSPSI